MIAAVASLLAFPVRAASFDCARAQSPDEVTVCARPTLSELDSEMGGLWYAYSRVPMLMGANGDRRDEAEAFIASRRACGSNVACLASAYRSRDAKLRNEIDAAMAQFASSRTAAEAARSHLVPQCPLSTQSRHRPAN
jgi:uncharacterized protein